MSMKCLGRSKNCNNNNCQKQVDVTGSEPKHVKLDSETKVIREEQEQEVKAKVEMEARVR